MTGDEIIRRGMAAKQLLESEIFILAISDIETECAQSWANSPPDDVSRREDAYRMNRAVSLVRQRLEAWRDNATIEKNNAEWRNQGRSAA